MAKLIMGVLILALILSLSILSTEYLEDKIDEICTEIDNTALLYISGDRKKAEITLEKSLQKWLGMESYVGSMLHSSKAELISEAFYDYKYALESSETNSEALKDKLIYLLQSMLEQEKISFGSIL